jgi:SAM-dependent methyltransferase
MSFPPLFLDDPARLRAFLDQYWYYAAELKPGLLTNGKRFQNIAATRELLSRADVAGQRCLDIGTMEALVPILLTRRGARDVVAIDGLNMARKVETLKAIYGTDFQYFGNVAMADTVRFFQEKLRSDQTLSRYVGAPSPRLGFDVVVLSGVLYHVFSPFHVLGIARSLLRTGGLMVIETAALKLPGLFMQFNFTGRTYVYGPSDVWFITAQMLDYMLRYFRLAPIDCVHIDQGNGLARIAVVARATDRLMAGELERDMEASTWNLDYDSIVRYDLCPADGLPPVPYREGMAEIARRADLGTCDLFETIQRQPTLPVDPRRLELRLDDRL